MIASAAPSGDGATLRGLVVGDDPSAWREVGFAVDTGWLSVGGVWVRLAGAAGDAGDRGANNDRSDAGDRTDAGDRGVRGWWFAPHAPFATRPPPPSPATVDGLTLVPAASRPPAPTVRGHPNGVDALDHVVIASPDVDRTTAALATIGVRPRRTVDGVRGDTQVRYRFFLAGTCVIEVVGPARPDPDAARQPARFAGLAFVAPRLDVFGEVATSPRVAVQPGRSIVTLRAPGISVPVAVLTPRPRCEPRRTP